LTPPSATDAIFLKPGEWYFGEAPARLRTLLGSCVAITVWHPATRSAGMCHFLLPSRRKHAHESLDARYADEAILLLAGQARLRGMHLRDCEVKIFGGGLMFGTILGARKETVGLKNAAAAKHLLAQHGVRPKCSDLGGHGHRAIVFDARNGDVWVRRGGGTDLPGAEPRTMMGAACLEE
jgi:chemotaxis protein CheD